MKVLTVGDSFTYGDELSDRSTAWPYLLQQKLNCELTNLGEPASGNTRMVRTVVESIYNYDLFIIAWSHYARIEFSDSQGTYDIWPGYQGKPFAIHHPQRLKIIDYISRYHNDEYLYKQYLINALLVQSYIKQHNKRYLMIDAFGNNYHDFDSNADIQQLRQRIDHRYYVGWPDQTMMEITYTLPKGPNGHFLEEGHQVVAETIFQHIETLGWTN